MHSARNVAFMSKTADQRIVVDGLGVLVPMADCRTRLIDDMPFFQTIRKKWFDPVLAYVAFCRRQQVDKSFEDLENLFFPSADVPGSDQLDRNP